jgi:hypothetical protein
MIPYRPIAPLTLGPGRGWKSVVAAVVMAALLGTSGTPAVAAGRAETSASAPAAG